MNSLYLKTRLAQIISRGEKHQDYGVTVENAEIYRKLLTGKDMDSLMRKFDKREDDDAFAQRKSITQHITKTVAQNVKDVYHKIPRSNSVQRFIGYTDNATERLLEFTNILEKFWGKMSLDGYMNTRWIDLNFLDPNTFVVVEWADFDNTKERAQPYPFEVSSQSAIMFEYSDDNILKYLVSLNEKSKYILYSGTETLKNYKVYTIYGDNQTIQFVQVIEDDKKAEIRKAFGMSTKLIKDNYFRQSVNTQDEYYEIVEFKAHNLGFVPAERIGVLFDLSTNSRTYVSPLDKGVPILMKMVKANSELDLTMALHTFPQKLQYVSKCHASDCKDGVCLDGSTCGVCGGLGYQTIKTAQEMITLAMPKTKEEMVDLDQIIKYVYPPVDLVTFQDKYIDKLTYQVKEAIFNTEIFSRQQVAETATGKNISLQNVYDALYPVALGYSADWTFFVKTIATVTQLDDKLVYFYKFSKDFKLKTLTDLYLDLKTVGDARASEFIKSSIEDDIAKVIYSESERELQKYNVRKAWFPFNGKTPEQITMLIGSNYIPEETKVLFANYSYIFDLIELEQATTNGKDFYYMPRETQWEIIQKKVKELSSSLEPAEPELDLENQQ